MWRFCELAGRLFSVLKLLIILTTRSHPDNRTLVVGHWFKYRQNFDSSMTTNLCVCVCVCMKTVIYFVRGKGQTKPSSRFCPIANQVVVSIVDPHMPSLEQGRNVIHTQTYKVTRKDGKRVFLVLVLSKALLNCVSLIRANVKTIAISFFLSLSLSLS